MTPGRSPSLTSAPLCCGGHREWPQGRRRCKMPCFIQSSAHFRLFLLFFSLHFSPSMLNPKALFSGKSQFGRIWESRKECPSLSLAGNCWVGDTPRLPSPRHLQESCPQRPRVTGREPPPSRQGTGSPCPPCSRWCQLPSHHPHFQSFFFFFPIDLCGLL